MTKFTAIGSTGRVTNLELFFDLVFVFTITQVTELLAHAHEAHEFARAFAALAIVWWMYAGYAWVSNNVAINQPRNRFLLLLAMGGFLVMSLALPQAFGRDGLAFGVAYFLVILIHAVLFSRAPNESARAIWRIAPLNFGTAGLIVAAAFFPESWNWIFWVVALVLYLVVPFWTSGGFAVEVKHFVERHGLVLLIALGESVVAIGIGAVGLPVTPVLIAAALMTLALIAALWWLYFEGNEHRAEKALEAAEGRQRGRRALYSFGYSKLIMITGIVACAAGIKDVLAHFTAPASDLAAGLVGAGVAIYLGGESLFRAALRIRLSLPRLVGLVVSVATVPLGTRFSGLVQVGAILACLGLIIVVERLRPVRD